MCEIQIPMKFKVDFNSEEDYQSVFDSLVDKGLVSSFSAKYNVSRVLDEKCKDGVYYFTVTKNKFFGVCTLDLVSKDEYDNLDYNIYSYHQNQWILYTDGAQMNSAEPRYCNGVKLPTAVDKIVHGKIYYYPTPTGYTKSGIIGFDEPDRITDLLKANLLYDNDKDSNIHSDAMRLTHSTENLDRNEPKEILIHEHDLTEMKIKIKNDEEFMILQQYFFNRGVGWLEFGGAKQFLDNSDTTIPIKYIYIVADDEKFYMVTGYTDEVFESSTYPLGVFDVLKVIK